MQDTHLKDGHSYTSDYGASFSPTNHDTYIRMFKEKVSAQITYFLMPACVIKWSQWYKGSRDIPLSLWPVPLFPLLLGFHPFLPIQWILVTQDPPQIYPTREKITLMNTGEHCCCNERTLPGLFTGQHPCRETTLIQNEWFLSPTIVRIRIFREALSWYQVNKTMPANCILSISTEFDYI